MATEVEVNPDYEGPDRTTYITLADPTLDNIETIPVGADIIVIMPSGGVTEWYWAAEMRSDMVEHLKAGGTLEGHLFIWVNPDILKDDAKQEAI